MGIPSQVSYTGFLALGQFISSIRSSLSLKFHMCLVIPSLKHVAILCVSFNCILLERHFSSIYSAGCSWLCWKAGLASSPVSETDLPLAFLVQWGIKLYDHNSKSGQP